MREAHTTPRFRLLVVDDQAINIQLLYQIFSADHEVFMATSGEQALSFCQNTPPDLILLDVLMPDLDGIEVCRRLKADPATADIPVVFVTGQNNPREEAMGLSVGGVDFISKPVNTAVVRARVKTHLMLKFQTGRIEEVNRTLEARVAERTAELQLAMEHLLQREKMATLGNLVAGITHELNTPLSNMRLASAALLDRVEQLAGELDTGKISRSNLDNFISYCRDSSALIERASQRSYSLIESFKRVSVDQSSDRRCQFDLRDIISHTVSTLRPTLRATPFTVEIDIPQGIILQSFPGPLEQIVTNLITNSIAHAFPDRSSGVMRVSARHNEDQLIITYEDDGVGISDDIKLRIFDPFFTTKAGQGGSGIGMYTVYNLVTNLYGGTIDVDGRPGKGARITAIFPNIPVLSNAL
ncbi:response regulator [Undibacterium sp. Jales W-56]|uniref:hybrid sensor histidine kinase/response regulator n=1 Tax=Undibacterium sp. Jales W-56 TaxID=2897325 RepID=UPI0021D23FD7|nr:response regulator [Undibacterium sp. Jales W-56]MCU6433818.1 response regulator [Undibacterium sp. Jales W-56]